MILNYFLYSAFSRIFWVSSKGPDLGIFGRRTQRGAYGRSNLRANYDSVKNTQEKGVS